MRPDSHERGFTLVELLVVMLVVGVLAGIAVPVLLHQQQRALHTQAVADLRSSAVAVESWLADDSARDPADLDGLDEVQLAASGVEVTTTLWTDFVLHQEGGSYCLAATHVQLPAEALVFRPGDGALPVAEAGAYS